MVRNSMMVLSFLMAWAALTLVSSTPEMGTYELSFLGTVEGKSYFLENIARNWTVSKKRCDESGMHLATITTAAQLTLLKSNYNVTGSQCYWTGARDSQTPSQFVWDYNKGPLNSSIFNRYNTQNGIQTCVAYQAYSATQPSLFFYSCEITGCYALCEIIHNRNL